MISPPKRGACPSKASSAIPSVHWFSTDTFLTTLAEVCFPGRPFRAAVHESHGHRFRVLEVEGRPPIVDGPLLDFLVPVAHGEVAGSLGWVPCAALDEIDLAGREPTVRRAPAGTEPAPFIRWDRFPSWEAFERHFSARRSSLVRDSRAKRRKLERVFGRLRFTWEDPRPEVFQACIGWKSGQYVRSGFVDVLRPPRHVALFRALHAKGSLVISSLSAGDRLLAAHFGALGGGRLYSWIAAYDPAVGRFSPGRLLLEDMLRESQRRGHGEWDFGLGDLEYKWHYATHCRLVRGVGTPPLAVTLGKLASSGVRRALSRSPKLLLRARRLRRFLETLRRQTDDRDP